MTSMTRLSNLAIPALVFAVFGGFGCSSSNPPATSNAATGGADATSETGGSPSTSTDTAATGGAGTGGSDPGTSTGTSDGSGGTTSISTTSANTGGSSGVTNTLYQPMCASTVSKGGPCTDTDQQLCYKTCGPRSIGFKSETCSNGAYAEQSGCSFLPDEDYSCYKIPATLDPSCPTTAPQASQVCTVAPCTPCAVGGMYLDSGGAQKQGYCVCPLPGDSGTSKWSCASTTAWPCPGQKGCS